MEQINNRPITKWAVNRIKANKNCLVVINGPTGGGKSYAAISWGAELAERLDTNFNIKDNVDFSFVGLLKKMSLPQNKKPGTPFVFEEVGAFGGGASSREWQSRANKFFFSFMQTSRHRNQILIMNCPNFSFLEKGARSMVHMQMEMKRIDKNKKMSYAKPFMIQINSRSGQFYFKYIQISSKGCRLKVKEISFDLPPKEIIKEYEAIKTKYTSKLNQAIIDDEKPKEVKKKCTLVEDRIIGYVKIGLKTAQIAKLEKVTPRAIRERVKRLRDVGKVAPLPILDGRSVTNSPPQLEL